MALSADDIIKIIKAAQDMGLVEPEKPRVVIPERVLSKEEIEKIFVPSTPFDDMTNEEILFYATPYYDVLQAEKEAKKQRIEEEPKP